MGWSSGYTVFEETVIGAYDCGKLDKKLLEVLMEPYRGTDIDSDGGKNLLSNDGKTIDQIMIETWGMEVPKKPEGKYKENPSKWDDYYDKIFDKVKIITNHFDWR